jgi:hypothetical protein
MPKYPDNYYLTRQEIEDLRADAKQASKRIRSLFDEAISCSQVDSMHQKIKKVKHLDGK